MRGYLSFDSLGENLDLERLPQPPILMDDFKDPTITFPPPSLLVKVLIQIFRIPPT